MRQRWPEKLWIVRHGQSAGNVARDAAHEAGLATIDIALRDVDVLLSDLGHEQARALGRWFAALPEGEKPEIVLSSPYVRARQTAKAICEAGGVTEQARQPIVDERLREREFGVFDRLTTNGIRQKHPDLAEHRALLGKFYFRAPGGESWADVILRLRGALDTISLHHADRRVLIVCHQVVVLCLRYILEEMDEAQIGGHARGRGEAPDRNRGERRHSARNRHAGGAGDRLSRDGGGVPGCRSDRADPEAGGGRPGGHHRLRPATWRCARRPARRFVRERPRQPARARCGGARLAAAARRGASRLAGRRDPSSP